MIRKSSEFILISLIFAVYCFFLLSNCSSNIQGTATAPSVAPPLLGFGGKYPFPFDTNISQIAYMSCSNMDQNFNKRAYFSIKAGAYNREGVRGITTAGVRFSDEFISLHGGKTAGEKVNAFNKSELNKNLGLLFGVYARYNLSQFQEVDNVELTNGLTHNLSHLELVKHISDLPSQGNLQRIGYFNNLKGLNDSRRIQGRVHANALNEENNQNFRGSLRGEGPGSTVFVVGYTAPELSEGKALLTSQGQSASGDTALGRGYKLNFSFGSKLKGTDELRVGGTTEYRKVLSRVDEFQLNQINQQNSRPTSWNCPSDYQFMIIRRSDCRGADNRAEGKVKCEASPRVSAAELSPNQKSIYNMLYSSDWEIDFKNRYIVSRTNFNGPCYGKESSRKQIDYFGNIGECWEESDGKEDVLCPHYVSFCFLANEL